MKARKHLLQLGLIQSVVLGADSRQVEVGNFSLPGSQQPGPLVSFGENILDKGTIQLIVFADGLIGNHSYSTQVIPGLLYGITDNFSVFFNVPFSPGNKTKNHHSWGLEDVFVQAEFAFYTLKESCLVDQATLVASVSFPTGSSTHNPPTGLGACSFFIGATFNRMGTDWFVFTSPGALLTTGGGSTQLGNQLLYELGFGRHIPSPRGWILAWMVEFDGTYAWKNKIHGKPDPNSGGNVIYATPSLWISSKNIILQVGVGYPLVHSLRGHPSVPFISFDFNFEVTF